MGLDPVTADLGLTSMARGRHTLETRELLTKTEAFERADGVVDRPAPGPTLRSERHLATDTNGLDRMARRCLRRRTVQATPHLG